MPPSRLRLALKRIPPIEALYVSYRATPTLRDAFVYSLFGSLAWCLHLLRFSRRLSVQIGALSRRLDLTFAILGADGTRVRLTLPIHPQAYWTLLEVFSHACYRPVVPIAPRTIVDAGANIGLSAVFLHGLFPAARIVCIEPDPANLPLLKRNLAQNGVNAVVVEAALGRVEGRVEFQVHRAASEYSSAGASIFPAREYRRISVAVKPLDVVLAEAGVERVGLLKIDIEGGEFDVFDGERALPPLEYVVGEFHGFAGDIGPLASGICRRTGLALLRRVGDDSLAILHFGRADV